MTTMDNEKAVDVMLVAGYVWLTATIPTNPTTKCKARRCRNGRPL